ncbi:MAG TPA: sugar phosphate isomerase/epimerase [Vicinamibacteria bacterium]|nr:sugar phosphate isomerase/epimerase [Vicinamibacteria bacterium]
MQTRRDFLRRTSYASAGMALASFGARPAQAALSGQWGVQLYTVREQLPKKPAETLKAIAALGYREVETLRPFLDLMPYVKEAGLSAPACHIEAPLVTGDWTAWKSMADAMKVPAASFSIDNAIADAKKHGIRFLTVSYLMPEERTTLDFFKKFADAMNKAGAKCAAAGITLCYHHHSFEFASLEGAVPMDVLVERFDKKLVGFELDVFWLSIAGQDPVKFIQKLGPRVHLLHLKDKAKGTPNELQERNVKAEAFAEVGSGVVDFPGILAAAKKAGVSHAFVEQDQTPGDPLDSLKKSIGYLKTLKV